MDALSARPLAGCNGNRPARDVKRGGEEGDERDVGGALDGRRVEPHEQRSLAFAGELGLRGAGNHADEEVDAAGDVEHVRRKRTG